MDDRTSEFLNQVHHRGKQRLGKANLPWGLPMVSRNQHNRVGAVSAPAPILPGMRGHTERFPFAAQTIPES